MTSTARLASLLRASDDTDLLATLERRPVAPAGIRDFFDLAETLLSDDSLQSCLERLDRRALAALAQLGERRMSASTVNETLGLDDSEVSRLRELQLMHEDSDGVAAWPEVADQLKRWPELGLPDPTAEEPEPGNGPVSESERHSADRLAAEHAFTAATATAELLFELQREPVRLLSRGAIGAPEKARLAAAMSVDELSIDTLVDAAERAGLVTREGHRFVASAGHSTWLGFSAAERWAVLAESWASRLPAGIRPVLAERSETLWGPGLREWLQWKYPGGRTWLTERVTAGLAEAERLGITAGDIVSTPGAALLGRKRDQAIALLTEALPAPVDRLYLQHDLSAVAPGPLEVAIDARLRSLAITDGRAIASRYRFTQASIGRAIAGGETSETILAFLSEISLSGVPQPLEYLVTETAGRHGLLRVGPAPAGNPDAASYVRSDDTALLGTVLVDRAFAALDFRPADGDRMVSRRDRSQVYWMLHDARYPVAAEDSQGRIVELIRPTARASTASEAPARAANPHRTLLEKLRIADAATPNDSGQAWFARELDAAIRSKSTVTVSVRMPNGEVVDYRLEPASVVGGRLRARDPQSEIERTLPLSSIAAVTTE